MSPRRSVLARAATVGAWLLAAAPGLAQEAQEEPVGIPVDVELVLAVDISGSMDRGEQRIQREGYVAAFLDEEVVSAMIGGYVGQVAVTYMEWAGEYDQYQRVPWTVIASYEDALAFADKLQISTMPLRTEHGTSISQALAGAANLIETNQFEGYKKVIDISGDGRNRNGPSVTLVRDLVASRGIIINGLPIMLSPSEARFSFESLDEYYRNQVIAGPGSFVIGVRSREELAGSIREKLILEIAGALTGREG